MITRYLIAKTVRRVAELYPQVRSRLGAKALALLEAYAVKTYAQYTSYIRMYVTSLFNKKTGLQEFVESLYLQMQRQLIEAWLMGMKENGLSQFDMTEEWANRLNDIINDEAAFILPFGKDIEAAASRGDSIDSLLSRAEAWGLRYKDVQNEARLLTAGRGVKLIWVMNPDKEHCETCAALNGIVAFASEWEEAGVKPQSPPNTYLECGGWRCGCELQPTDRRRSSRAFDRILEAI